MQKTPMSVEETKTKIKELWANMTHDERIDFAAKLLIACTKVSDEAPRTSEEARN